jgi:hypothetical protein
MSANVLLPLASSVLSFAFAVLLLDQWRTRRRSYQLIWAAGMVFYGLGAGTEYLGTAFGWSEVLYKVWYLAGAICVAAWLGLGTAALLSRTKFGYTFAVVLLLGGLIAVAARGRYPDAGAAPIAYFLVAAGVSLAIVLLLRRGDQRWLTVAAGGLVAGTIAAAVMIAVAVLPAPGWAVNPSTGIPTGELFPGAIRLLTPVFNVVGAGSLVLGALYSAYAFMPKKQVFPYVRTGLAWPLKAAIAVPATFVASIPTAFRAWRHGELNSRVPSTILIAIGGIIPAITSGATRFGETSAFFLGEFLGVVFLFMGFLVSIEVFREIRVPFTHIVLRRRPADG